MGYQYWPRKEGNYWLSVLVGKKSILFIPKYIAQ